MTHAQSDHSGGNGDNTDIISLLIIGQQATVLAKRLNYSHSTIILNNLLEIYNTSFDLE